MGNLFAGSKKLTERSATPTSSRMDDFPRFPDRGRVYKERTAEKTEDEQVTVKSEEVTDKSNSSESEDTSSKDDSQVNVTDKEAVLRHAMKELKLDGFTRYDFGIDDSCGGKSKKKRAKKEKKKICTSDSDDEKEPCSEQEEDDRCKDKEKQKRKKPCREEKEPCGKKKVPCSKQGIPCSDVEHESFGEVFDEIDHEEPCKAELKQPIKVISKKAPEKTEKKPKVEPPCKVSPPTTTPPPTATPSSPTASADLKGKTGGSVSVCGPGSQKEVQKSKGIKFPSGFKGMGQSGGKMIGDYPVEYNAKVHGPYDPARYYGKPDTPFGQVKLGELTAWLGRRNKHPQAIIAAFSRAHWRWQHKYHLPKRSTAAPLMQVVVAFMILSYSLNRYKIQYHTHFKYH